MLPARPKAFGDGRTVQPHQPPGRRRRRERADHAGGVQPAPVKAPPGDAAEPCRNFVAGDNGRSDLSVVRAAGFADCQGGWHHDRTGMHDRILEGIVEIAAMGRHAMDEGRPGRRRPAPARHDAGLVRRALPGCNLPRRHRGFGRRAGQDQAQRIEHAQADRRMLGSRDIRPLQAGNPIRQDARRRPVGR